MDKLPDRREPTRKDIPPQAPKPILTKKALIGVTPSGLVIEAAMLPTGQKGISNIVNQDRKLYTILKNGARAAMSYVSKVQAGMSEPDKHTLNTAVTVLSAAPAVGVPIMAVETSMSEPGQHALRGTAKKAMDTVTLKKPVQLGCPQL